MKDRKNKERIRSFKRPIQNFDAKKVSIENINLNSKGKIIVEGIVDRVVQTGGPTIFGVSDGTGSLSIKGFIGPGQRAYPEIDEGDVVKATVSVGEFQGELEGEISSIKKLGESEKSDFLKRLGDMEMDRAKIAPPEFLVKDIILDKLKFRFIEAATQIRLAIIQNRPIIVRHHNDADGYSSGFSLERAILPLIIKQHSSVKAPWEFFLRAPCQAPYYEIDDSIKDMANSLRNVAKFSNKMPLIIIADNGSTQEDLMGIKQGKVHGADFIVIDHHPYDKDVISPEVLVHINPFLVGEEGTKFSAGMLCTEIARFINPEVKNISQIPAMAGFADRIDLANPGVVEQYLKIAEVEGYSKELLADIALVIDYASAKLRFMEAREYIEVLFGEPRDKQKNLINLMAPYIHDLDRKGVSIGKSNAKHEKMGKTVLQSIEIEDTFPGFGFFPKPGRAVSLIHDDYQHEKNVQALVTAGIMSTAITLRATDEANFSFHELLGFLNKKAPEAFVSGGGHKNAGSLTFLPYKKDEIVRLLKEFIKQRN
jgi:RecJ-like exonuclease